MPNLAVLMDEPFFQHIVADLVLNELVEQLKVFVQIIGVGEVLPMLAHQFRTGVAKHFTKLVVHGDPIARRGLNGHTHQAKFKIASKTFFTFG